jgi:hypothetical protein
LLVDLFWVPWIRRVFLDSLMPVTDWQYSSSLVVDECCLATRSRDCAAVLVGALPDNLLIDRVVLGGSSVSLACRSMLQKTTDLWIVMGSVRLQLSLDCTFLPPWWCQ